MQRLPQKGWRSLKRRLCTNETGCFQVRIGFHALRGPYLRCPNYNTLQAAVEVIAVVMRIFVKITNTSQKTLLSVLQFPIAKANCCQCGKQFCLWYQFLTWNKRGNSWILKICLARKMNHVDYTQSPIIRNNPIRFGAEFLGKFKKRVVLGRSNLRNASKNLRNGQCSDFQS